MPEQYKYKIELQEVIPSEPQHEYKEVFSIQEDSWEDAVSFFDNFEKEDLYDKDKYYILEINSFHKSHPEQTYTEKVKSYNPYMGWE